MKFNKKCDNAYKILNEAMGLQGRKAYPSDLLQSRYFTIVLLNSTNDFLKFVYLLL